MCSQAVAAYLAKEFSLRYPESPIEFVKAELLDLGEDTPFPFRYMAIEPFIPGEYEKKTSNAGHIAKDSDLAQAFSHFTWDVTEGDRIGDGFGNHFCRPHVTVLGIVDSWKNTFC